VGSTAKVGCVPVAILPGIAPTPDGFLVAAARPFVDTTSFRRLAAVPESGYTSALTNGDAEWST
jgi:hypothetical protein